VKLETLSLSVFDIFHPKGEQYLIYPVVGRLSFSLLEEKAASGGGRRRVKTNFALRNSRKQPTSILQSPDFRSKFDI